MGPNTSATSWQKGSHWTIFKTSYKGQLCPPNCQYAWQLHNNNVIHTECLPTEIFSTTSGFSLPANEHAHRQILPTTSGLLLPANEHTIKVTAPKTIVSVLLALITLQCCKWKRQNFITARFVLLRQLSWPAEASSNPCRPQARYHFSGQRCAQPYKIFTSHPVHRFCSHK